MTITVSKNEYRTIFVEVDGVHVADSATMNRRRGFWNAATKQYVPAPDFTERKICKEPARGLRYLARTGMPVVGRVVLAF